MNQIETMRQALDAIATGRGKFEAIKALRQAIEQAEKVEPVGIVGHELWGKFVADITGEVVEGDKLYLHPPTAPAQPSPLDAALVDRLVEQAQQPLSNEQILHFVDIYVGGPTPSYPLGNSDWINFARAIEQAHGIKGASL